MNRRRIGRTSLDVTELGFGGASVGNLHRATTDEEARSAIDRAWDVGIRYFDTAPHYGLGLSESRIGAALADRPRESYVLSTKVGRLLEPNPAPTGSDLDAGGFDVADSVSRRFDFSADGVRRSLAASLGRLGLDRIDIVYVHDPDDHVEDAVSQAIPALVELREQGVIGAVGVGINQWSPALRIVRECDVDVVMLAGRWTLADRSGQPLLDEAAGRGVSIIAAAPYNSGLLAQPWPPDGAIYNYAPASVDVLRRARRLAEICQLHGITLPDAALQFPLRESVVASVVCGMRTSAQVGSTAVRAGVSITDDAWAELDAEQLQARMAAASRSAARTGSGALPPR